MALVFDLDELAKSAVERTGLDDFGPGDWHEALARLLRAAREEARLSAAGEAILRMQAVDRLSNRLQIQDWVKAHPDVHDLEI
ncbi:MAG: sulfotransferase, partial [Myxococcota bacterium]